MNCPLNDLKPGQSGTVSGFAKLDDGAEHLMQMGVLEGTDISVLRYAPTGDPVEIRVMGYSLSLRLADAANVLVDNVTKS